MQIANELLFFVNLKKSIQFVSAVTGNNGGRRCSSALLQFPLLPTILTTFWNKFVVFLEIKRAREVGKRISFPGNWDCIQINISSVGILSVHLGLSLRCLLHSIAKLVNSSSPVTSAKLNVEFFPANVLKNVPKGCVIVAKKSGKTFGNKTNNFKKKKIFKIEKCCLYHFWERHRTILC